MRFGVHIFLHNPRPLFGQESKFRTATSIRKFIFHLPLILQRRAVEAYVAYSFPTLTIIWFICEHISLHCSRRNVNESPVKRVDVFSLHSIREGVVNFLAFSSFEDSSYNSVTCLWTASHELCSREINTLTVSYLTFSN
jgi:hypothetical protein